MDRQLTLRLGTPDQRASEARRYIARLGWPDRELAVLALLAAHGDTIEIRGQELWRYRGSVATCAGLAGCAKGTWLAAVASLVERGVLEVLRDTQPHTYVASWSRLVELLNRLPAAADGPSFEAQLDDLLRPDWGASVSAGQGRSVDRVRVRRPSNARVTVDRVRDRDTEGLTVPDRAGGLPWQQFDSEDLRRAVLGGDLKALRGLYDEALRAGWISADDADARLRFLVICHHCAVAAGFSQSRMGGVIARVRRGLDVSRIPQRSEDWARRQLRRTTHQAASRVPVPDELLECLTPPSRWPATRRSP